METHTPQAALRAVVINLARDLERWSWVESNFNNVGVSVERLEAIDAKVSNVQDLIASLTIPGSGLSQAEAACILSHRKAWQLLVDSGDDYLAIFEDDVHVAADMRELLDPRLLQRGVDLVKLEIPIGKASYRRKADAHFASRALHKLISKAFGSAGYILSRRCASRLLVLTEKCEEPVDVILFDDKSPIRQEFGVLQVVPAACIQDFLLAKRQNKNGVFASSIEADRNQTKSIRHARKRKARKSVPLRKLGQYLRSVLLGAHPLRHKDDVPLRLS